MGGRGSFEQYHRGKGITSFVIGKWKGGLHVDKSIDSVSVERW